MKHKTCPFCGNDNIIVITCMDEPCAYKDIGVDCNHCQSKQYAVCCSVNEGGCGATSGWCWSTEQATERWERRVEK